LPGIVILAIAILGFFPSIQKNTPAIGRILLAFVGLLLAVFPDLIWKLFHIYEAEANMWVKRGELEKREQKLVLLEPVIEDMEKLIKEGNITQRLDFVINGINWRGLEEISYPYFEVECEITSRFLLDLAFKNIDNIQFELAIVDNILESKGRAWIIVNKATLIYLQNKKTGNGIQLTSKKQIVGLNQTVANFKFGWNDGYTRDKIEANYKDISKIKLRFKPEWEFVIPDGRLVTFRPPSIDKEFPISLV